MVLSEDGFVCIFDSRTGEQLSQFFTTSSASAIVNFSLSPSDERILIGGHDGVARVWDLDSGTQLLAYEVGGFNEPAYSPDGRWVLIGSTEGNVARVWDLATGTQLLGYKAGGANFPSYSPDGSRVAIGSTSGTEGNLHIFPTWHSAEELIKYAREHCVFRELTAEERALFGLPERG